MLEKPQGSVIVNCTCVSEFQDSLYGKGKRAANRCGNTGELGRCTVCGSERKIRADMKAFSNSQTTTPTK